MKWYKLLLIPLVATVVIGVFIFLNQKNPENMVKQAKEEHLTQMMDYYSSNKACLEGLVHSVLLLPNGAAYLGVESAIVPDNGESIPVEVQESIKRLRLSEKNNHPYLSLSPEYVAVELVDETNIMAWIFYSTKFELEDKKKDYNYIEEFQQNWFVAITYIERG